MKKSLLVIFITLFLNGCFSVENIINPNNKEDTTNFHELTSKLLEDGVNAGFFKSDICQKIKKESNLYVIDFVNQAKLENKSQLGFVLSNSLKVNLLNSQCVRKNSIKTLDLAKYPVMDQNGARMLTRELQKMKTKSIQDDKQILIGTYTITSKQLLLFLKLVDLETGDTIATSSTTTYITNEILNLEGIPTKEADPIINQPFHL